jgi:hypothetical protein
MSGVCVYQERFTMAARVMAAVVVVVVALVSLSGAEARLSVSSLSSSWVASSQEHLNETTVVPNQFIVRFSSDSELLDYDTVEQRAALVARLLGARILHVYHYTFSGVALEANHNSSSSGSSTTTTNTTTTTTTTRSSTTTIPTLTLTRAQEILSRAAATSSSRHSSSLFLAIEEVRVLFVVVLDAR